ncbi:MAG: hypothetical protein K0R14_452 [Burkholderiales bacterium]|jgi:hypothetical protein|nr:hypothetical protein [Burkholderiales bacterium]
MKRTFEYFKLAILGYAGILAGCSSGNSSGTTPPVTQYTAFSCPGTVNVSFPGISGIRGITNSTNVYITGVYVQYGANQAFLYQGPVLGGGTCTAFNYPTATGRTVTATALYGPDNGTVSGNVVLVGSYTTVESGPISQQGLLYQGASDGSTTNGWMTLNPSSLARDSIINTIGHSTMGGLVVGNFDTISTTGRSFIYNINTGVYTEFTIPGSSASVTLYGIWYNGGTSYTLTGGYSAVSQGGIDLGFLADWDSSTQTITNFVSLNYNNLSPTQAGTHFEGITTDGNGGYNLSGDWQVPGGTANPVFVHVIRNANGSFGNATWTNFSYPKATATSANTVYQNYVLGLYQLGTTLDYGYVATIVSN